MSEEEQEKEADVIVSDIIENEIPTSNLVNISGDLLDPNVIMHKIKANKEVEYTLMQCSKSKPTSIIMLGIDWNDNLFMRMSNIDASDANIILDKAKKRLLESNI